MSERIKLHSIRTRSNLVISFFLSFLSFFFFRRQLEALAAYTSRIKKELLGLATMFEIKT